MLVLNRELRATRAQKMISSLEECFVFLYELKLH